MIICMNNERITVSLPPQSLDFIKKYKEAHELKSNSQVVLEALRLLERQQLREEFTRAAADAQQDEALITATLPGVEEVLDEAW